MLTKFITHAIIEIVTRKVSSRSTAVTPTCHEMQHLAPHGRVVADPESDYALRYKKGARQLAIRLATKKKDYSQHFPKIVIEES